MPAPVSTLSPQATSLKTLIRNCFFVSGHLLKRRSVRRSAPRPGSATHAYRRSEYETTTRRPSRHCSRVRRPRFPHLAPSHIPQATDPKLLFRTRTPTQNTFGEAFGEARAATVESGFASKTARLRGQRPLLQKKKNLGARATYLR